MPKVRTWPSIRKAFDILAEKLEHVPPDLRGAVIDYWVGQLFLLRSENEFRTTEVTEADLKKYGYR